MSISPDFFFDLTPKGSSPSFIYDFESELLPVPKKKESALNNYSFAKNLQISSSNTHNELVFSNGNVGSSQKCSRSNDKFKITIIKKNNTLKNPVKPHLTKKFVINKLNTEVNDDPKDDILILF